MDSVSVIIHRHMSSRICKLSKNVTKIELYIPKILEFNTLRLTIDDFDHIK